jgi:hypothetical protein
MVHGLPIGQSDVELYRFSRPCLFGGMRPREPHGAGYDCRSVISPAFFDHQCRQKWRKGGMATLAT